MGSPSAEIRLTLALVRVQDLSLCFYLALPNPALRVGADPSLPPVCEEGSNLMIP